MPYVKKHSLDDIYLGLKTGSFSDKTARNVIILSAESREDIDRKIREIRDALKISVRTRRGVEGPVWE